MSYSDIVLIGTLIVQGSLTILTFYRIKIEKRLVKVTEENAECKRRLDIFKLLISKEKEEILRMSPQEIYDMLEKVICNSD